MSTLVTLQPKRISTAADCDPRWKRVIGRDRSTEGYSGILRKQTGSIAGRLPTERRKDRPHPASKALDQIVAGDVLMVTRLDRLTRSTRDLLNILAMVADHKAGFQSLGDAWADTTSPRPSHADCARRGS